MGDPRHGMLLAGSGPALAARRTGPFPNVSKTQDSPRVPSSRPIRR